MILRGVISDRAASITTVGMRGDRHAYERQLDESSVCVQLVEEPEHTECVARGTPVDDGGPFNQHTQTRKNIVDPVRNNCQLHRHKVIHTWPREGGPQTNLGNGTDPL